jgi:hypothetical protein
MTSLTVTRPSEGGLPDALVDTNLLLPSPGRPAPRDVPERALARAVVEQALRDVALMPSEPSGGTRGDRRAEQAATQRDAARWLWSDSRSSPYAFANLADYLGIDATRVRHLLAMRGVRA